jgi:hypothetical protein
MITAQLCPTAAAAGAVAPRRTLNLKKEIVLEIML